MWGETGAQAAVTSCFPNRVGPAQLALKPGTHQGIKHTFGSVASIIACIDISGCSFFSPVEGCLDTALGLRTGFFVGGFTVFTGLAVWYGLAMSGFLIGVASRMSSVMKAAALDCLGAEVGEELVDGISSWPQAWRRGEEMTGVVALFSLEVEALIPFTGSFDCGTPFGVVSFTPGTLVEGPAVVGSVDD